jgi:hypothetical protein
VPGGDESGYEPGSNEEVLRNLLGITDPDEMGALEWDKFEAMAQASLAELERSRAYSRPSPALVGRHLSLCRRVAHRQRLQRLCHLLPGCKRSNGARSPS